MQLVKDYGLILDIIGSSSAMTGFIVNEQKLKTDKTLAEMKVYWYRKF